VTKGKVVAIQNDMALVDVGLKVEGWVALKEFGAHGQAAEVKIGDEIEVFVERIENRHGEAVLSREKARREEAWERLEKAFQGGERVEGAIFGRVKGGFTVDINGAVAFLPGSQVDIRPVRDIGPLIGTPQPFQILKMDRRRGNIVVSRRAVLEDSRAEERRELVANLVEGQVLEGMVKNITDYGAFIDLGGVDGLLHVTDMSWRRVNHPSEIVQVGQTVKVQVIRFNPETQRISLGMKQLEADPWSGVSAKYPVGTKLKGRVTNITDYGAFVELEPGVEGLVHVSEMSWTRRVRHPSKLVNVGDEVDVQVLDVNKGQKRISLGMKQVEPDPWDTIDQRYQPGMRVQGKVRNLTDFGAFVELEPGIDGLLHISDMTWARNVTHPSEIVKKSQQVETLILHVDKEAKRISLGLKQIQPDPWESAVQKYPLGANVRGKVVRLAEFGAFVELEPGVDGLLHISQMSHRPVSRPEDVVQVGDELTLKVIRVDSNERRIGLSLKDLAADLTVAEDPEQHGRRGWKRDRDRYDEDDDE